MSDTADAEHDEAREPNVAPLPWHASLWSPMASALAAGRVAHGLVFCGPSGVGKRRFAARTAAALLCPNVLASGDACGQCARCRQRRAGTHPDISRLVPEAEGGRIKVEQVRRFAHTLHLTPQYDTGRLGWIDPADALTPSAANSLLKTLEEPPGQCHILLVTDRLSALLPTIRSRCQQWRVPAADLATGRAWLEERGVPIEDLDAQRLGAPLKMLSAHESGLAEQTAAWDDDLARLLTRSANPVRVAERAAAADRGPWADWLYRRAAQLLAVCVDTAQVETGHLDRDALAAVRRIGAPSLVEWTDHVGYVVRNVQANADWRLMLESLFIDLGARVGAQRR